MKHYVIKNKKTIKAMRKFRMKHGPKPLPTKLWEMIYNELGLPPSGTPWVVMSNVDEGFTYIVEGINCTSDVETMAVEDIAKFPGALQEIIFEARSGAEYYKGVSMSVGYMGADGKIKVVARRRLDDL